MIIANTSSVREHRCLPTKYNEMATGQNELLFAKHSMLVNMQLAIVVVLLQGIMRGITQNRAIVANFVYVKRYNTFQYLVMEGPM